MCVGCASGAVPKTRGGPAQARHIPSLPPAPPSHLPPHLVGDAEREGEKAPVPPPFFPITTVGPPPKASLLSEREERQR